MAYPISDVPRRIVYSGSAGVGPYAFTFEVLANTDIAVYKNTTLLTLTTDYTVSINAGTGTGTVTLVVAATGADSVTLVGDRAIERTSDFVTGGDLFASTLNDELDSLTIAAQQVDEKADRAMRARVTDPTSLDMTLPAYGTRANKLLGFTSGGAPTTTTSTVAQIDAAVSSFVNATGNNASSILYTPAGTGAVATTVQTKLRETVSVKDFGAVGDGVVDDTAAIQAALNSFGLVSTAVRGEVLMPRGTYKITGSLYLPFEVSLVGDAGRATIISAQGNFEAIRWNSAIPSYSRQVTISDIYFVGAGIGSGYANNTAIRIDHPWGLDQLSLKNLWIDGFAGYGIQTDQQGSHLTTNCFQFSHWESIYIKNCGVGILMGEGFCGESTFDNIVIQSCTTYGLEFSIGPVAGAQGLTFTNFVTGQCPTGIYFGAGTAGLINFNGCHFENLTSYGVRFNSGSTGQVNFNQSWFVNNPTGIQCDAGTVINLDSCVWQTTGAAGDKYINASASSSFNINLTGEHKKNGSAPTNELSAIDINIFKGSLFRTAATTGTITGQSMTKVLVQTRGLMSETATIRPNNLAGKVAIGSGASSVSVSLLRTETDGLYVPLASVHYAGSSTTTGSISSGSTSLTVTSASGFAIGDTITVAGAGVSGATLSTTVSNVVGTTITLAAAASTTVSNAAVVAARSNGANWQPGISISNMTTTGFIAYFSSAAPSSGFALSWMLVR